MFGRSPLRSKEKNKSAESNGPTVKTMDWIGQRMLKNNNIMSCFTICKRNSLNDKTLTLATLNYASFHKKN